MYAVRLTVFLLARHIFNIFLQAFFVMKFQYNLISCCETSLNNTFFVGTSNHLNDNSKGYENITVAHNLGLPDLKLLRFVHEQITPGECIGVCKCIQT